MTTNAPTREERADLKAKAAKARIPLKGNIPWKDGLLPSRWLYSDMGDIVDIGNNQAAYIVAAANLAPRLLEALEEAERENERLRGTLAWYADPETWQRGRLEMDAEVARSDRGYRAKRALGIES